MIGVQGMPHDEPEPEKGIIRTLKPALAVEHHPIVHQHLANDELEAEVHFLDLVNNTHFVPPI
jgi:hypothetical protein